MANHLLFSWRCKSLCSLPRFWWISESVLDELRQSFSCDLTLEFLWLFLIFQTMCPFSCMFPCLNWQWFFLLDSLKIGDHHNRLTWQMSQRRLVPSHVHIFVIEFVLCLFKSTRLTSQFEWDVNSNGFYKLCDLVERFPYLDISFCFQRLWLNSYCIKYNK